MRRGTRSRDVDKDTLLPPHLQPPRHTLVSRACDAIESVIDTWSPPGRIGLSFLEDNFAPVEESGPVHDLPVTGKLPAELNGVYLRNGPNPRFKPRKGYHWFDGDGMLHSVRIKDGSASYCCRYVRTRRLQQEEALGGPKFLKYGDTVGYFGVIRLLLQKLRESFGVLDASHGVGTANTSLVLHSGRLLALHEGDAPYKIQLEDERTVPVTVGRETFGGKLGHSMCPHPKIDPITGEMFLFGYNVEKAPYLTYSTVSSDGHLGPPVPIPLPEPTMAHDFAITENYAIFMDLPLVFDPLALLLHGKPPFLWKGDSDRPSRFGVLPRYARSAAASIKWFELPPMFIFHTGNAWEDGDEVVLYACRFDRMTLEFHASDDYPGRLFEFRFHMKSGRAQERKLGDFSCDYPVINSRCTGRRNRFLYCSVFASTADIIGIVKFDLSADSANRGQGTRDSAAPSFSGQKKSPGASGQQHQQQEGGRRRRRGQKKEGGEGEEEGKEKEKGELIGGAVAGYCSLGPGSVGSETVFIPRRRSAQPSAAAPENGGLTRVDGASDAKGMEGELEEDDGYLVCVVYQEDREVSELVVIDAKTMSPDPVAVVTLPSRVPYGFHGLFIPEEAL